MRLVGLLHVNELLLQTPVLLQELFQLSGMVLKVTRVSGVEMTARASLSLSTSSPAVKQQKGFRLE